MNDHVWVSRIQDAAELIIMFSSDIVERDEALAIEGLNALKAGNPVPPDQCPTKVWPVTRSSQSRPNATLPPVFNANGYWVVSGPAADILQRFNLGGGALYPVNVLMADRTTPYPGKWHCWVQGNRKSAFTLPDSRNVPSRGGSGSWGFMPDEPQDGDVAVTSAALEGPDVWLDPQLFKAIFLSGALGDALAGADLRQAFRLTKARLVRT